jgi:hypothetical protein
MTLLGIYFWREGFEAALGPERRGEKGGCSLFWHLASLEVM